MNTTQALPTRLATIGMDQRQRNALHMLFSTKCDNRYVLMEEESSEICLLDMDVINGEHLWLEFRQRHPQHPLILVSLEPRDVVNEHTKFVQKPIPIEQLIATIDQLSISLKKAPPPRRPIEPKNHDFGNLTSSSQPKRSRSDSVQKAHTIASLMSHSQEQAFIGTSPDIDPNDPAQLAKIYHNPEHYLQGHMQQALNLSKRYNKNVVIKGPWPDIDLIAEGQRVLVDTTERQPRSLIDTANSLNIPLAGISRLSWVFRTTRPMWTAQDTCSINQIKQRLTKIGQVNCL
jgi:hypothetical protein